MKRLQPLTLILVLLTSCSPVRLGVRPESQGVEFVNRSSSYPVTVARFEAEVNEDSVAQAISFIEESQASGAKAIVIEWNSPGGSVGAGFKLSKVIEDSPIPVVCVVDGDAASMAYYILQSCHQRLMTKRSSLLIHQPSVAGEFGGGYIRWSNISERLRILARAIIEHCSARTHMTADEMEKKVDRGVDYWLDWREALHIGAVDGVVPSTSVVLAELRKSLTLPASTVTSL